jgi:hypothetical protein
MCGRDGELVLDARQFDVHESSSTCSGRAVAITSGGTISLPACAIFLMRGIPCIASVSKFAYATATVLRLQWRHGPQRINGQFVDQERTAIMDLDSVRGIDRRRLVGWAAAGVVAAGAPLVGAQLGHAASAPEQSGHDRIPPDTRPGGAYDRYVAQLAAEDKFSGVVLLSHRGRTACAAK